MKKPDLVLPYNWKPRPAQKPAMNAWIRENTLVNDWIWHRRFGKDDCALHGTAIKAHQRVANYWHMLPQKDQVRKAVWEAINPRTGKRRIDEAFPDSICHKRDTDMFIRFNNGSTWQCLGSDSFKGAIGSAPAGIVWSEWGLSDPASYAYLAPILKDNKGWVVRQGTPRGKNHAWKTYQSGLNDPTRFAQLLTAHDTGVDKILDMESIKQEYIDLYDEELGTAIFLQEYYCSFEAAVFGSVWGGALSKLEADGRFTRVPHNPAYKVFTAWDIGHTDATAIWFFQVINNQVHIIDFEQANLKNPDYYASQVLGKKVTINLVNDEVVVVWGDDIEGLEHRRAYDYEKHNFPHDAKAKTLIAKGKSFQQQMSAVFGWENTAIVPSLSIQDGLTAARKMLEHAVIDTRCLSGFEALKQYKYKYDDEKKIFSIKPVHDWTSHPADALRYLAIAYKTVRKVIPKPKPDPNHMDKGIIIEHLFQPEQNKSW